MRVLFLTSKSDRPELALIAGLAKRGVECVVMGDISIKSSVPGEFIELSFNSKFDLKASRLIRQQLKSRNFDIAHAFTTRALTCLMLASNSIKIRRIGYRGNLSPVSRINPLNYFNYLCPKLNAVSCASEAVRQHLLRSGLAAHKLFTIYKGHDVNWYRPVTTLPIPVTKNDFLVGYAANMRREKGIYVLLEAAKLLPRVQFLLIGRVKDQALPSLKIPNIHFLGFREDAAAILGACHVSVMPSLREGFPKAVIESMAQAVPVIVSNVGGMPEMIKNEEEGLIVEANNPQALVQAISRMQSQHDFRLRCGDKARERVKRDFTVENTVNKTWEMYQVISDMRN